MPRTVTKTAPVLRAKALTDADQPGTFEAVVSVFGNTDLDGDVVTPGAFTRTLADGGKPIVWSHDWLTPPIGETLDASETDEGLLVKGRLFVADDEDHQVARQVYAGLRAGALREFSWGGRVTRETRVEDPDTGAVTYELNEIDLVEYGPCLKGANPDTRLIDAKSLLLAGNNASIADARAALGLPRDAGAPALKATSLLSELRDLLDLPAEATREDILAAIRGTSTEAPAGAPAKTSPPVGGGDPQQRARVAALLI